MNRILVACGLAFLAVSAGLGALECPECGAALQWDGQVRVEGNRILYHYTCFCGADTWSALEPVRISPYGSTGDLSTAGSAEDSDCAGLWGWGPGQVTCPMCGAAACFTGEIRFVKGRAVRVYLCLAGHETVGN